MPPVEKARQQKMLYLENCVLSYSRSYFHPEERVSQHLYLVSDREIKVGDIALERLVDGAEHIFQIDNENDFGRKNQRKMEATTNILAATLPKVPESFVLNM